MHIWYVYDDTHHWLTKDGWENSKVAELERKKLVTWIKMTKLKSFAFIS